MRLIIDEILDSFISYHYFPKCINKYFFLCQIFERYLLRFSNDINLMRAIERMRTVKMINRKDDYNDLSVIFP